MITGRFVSCYSCAGEGSDQFLDQLGKRDVLVTMRLSRVVQAEPLPDLEARVLYSLIIFQNYTAITFKYRAGVGSWMGRGRLGFWDRWGEGWWDSGKAHLTD